MGDMVQSAVERLDRQYNDKGVVLDAHIPEELPQVNVDEYRIGQVLTNLVGNALQYTPPGGACRDIRCRRDKLCSCFRRRHGRWPGNRAPGACVRPFLPGG